MTAPSTFFSEREAHQGAHVEVSAQRTYDAAMPPWLLTISVPPSICNADAWSAAYPQTRAVMDDFGTLIITKAWS